MTTRCELHNIARCTVCLGIYEDERYEAPVPTGTESIRVIHVDVRPFYRPNSAKPKPTVKVPAHPLYHSDPTTAQRLRAKPSTDLKGYGRTSTGTLPQARTAETLTEWAARLGVTL